MYNVFEQLLQKNNVTSYKVSKETGIAQSVLSSWKNGVSTPKLDKLQMIAGYFGVTLDYLIGATDVPNIQYENADSFFKDLRLNRIKNEIEKEPRKCLIGQPESSQYTLSIETREGKQVFALDRLPAEALEDFKKYMDFFTYKYGENDGVGAFKHLVLTNLENANAPIQNKSKTGIPDKEQE